MSPSILLYVAIFSFSSSFSFFSFSCSREVSCCSFVSRTAWACLFVKSNFFINVSDASAAFLDFLMSVIISSIFFSAINKPITISILSSAFFNSNLVLLVTICFLYFTYSSKTSFIPRTFGCP